VTGSTSSTGSPTAPDPDRVDAGPAFAAAAARDGARSVHLRVAGRSMRLEATGDLLDALQPAFGHLVQDTPPPLGALSFRAWEHDQHRHPLWDPEAPAAYRTLAGGIVARGELHATPHLEAYRPGIGIELWGPPGALHHADHTLRPAGRSTFTWADGVGLRLLHAAAVEHDGTAALLVGPSGAGKTTTAIACAERGAGQLGDDTCLVDVGARVVHSLYATSAANPDTLGRSQGGTGPVLGEAATGKVVVPLAARGALRTEAPITALVVLRSEGDSPADGPRPLAVLPTSKALFASTLLPGVAHDRLEGWFADNLRLARTVPAFEVTRGWDLDRVVAQVREAIERGRRQLEAP
jgi:hypothetical protein